MADLTLQLIEDQQLIPHIVTLYQDVTKHLESTINYPNWKTDVYPNEENARESFERQALFGFFWGEELIGSVILDHSQREGYRAGHWSASLPPEEVFVIHTLAIHPRFGNQGYAGELVEQIKTYAQKQGAKAIRLDAVASNLPAHRLYEKHGYQRVGTVSQDFKDLGLGILDCYLYELVL